MVLDVELSRYVIVVSVIVVAALYARFQYVTGGSLTPGYVVLLILDADVAALISLVAFTVITVIVVRGVILQWFVLTRPWVYGMGILVSALSHSVLRLGSDLVEFPGALGLVLLAGLYVTPGILAYDLVHQGVRKTTEGLVIAVTATLVLTVPVLISGVLPEGFDTTSRGAIDTDWWWLAVTVAVAAALALRMARHLATAGYIGVVFILAIAEWQSLVVLALCVVVARLIAMVVIVLGDFTPRQRFQLSFLVGAFTSWTVLFWLARIGVDAGEHLYSFVLEPIVVAGLVCADLCRVSPARTAIGIGTSSVLVLVSLWGVSAGLVPGVLAISAVSAVIVILAWPAIRALFAAVGNAADIGRRYAEPSVGRR